MTLLAVLACGTPAPSSSPSTTPTDPVVCGEILLPDGGPSGLELCTRERDGATRVDRASGPTCPASVDTGAPDVCAPSRYLGVAYCNTDADCGTAETCELISYYECRCVPACATDQDCGGDACLCAMDVPGMASYPRCFPATCLTAGDCASGACGLSADSCFAVAGAYCRDPAVDDCSFDADCPASSGERCIYSVDLERWTCADYGLSCAE